MRLMHVVGARPNFMKAAPVILALAKRSGIEQCLVHTGQHYDANMSHIFFQQLGIPAADINLEVGSGTHAVQTAQIMMRFEEAVLEDRPDGVLVYGDVNSTIAAALVCAKLGIRVGHVEAGLRSFDRSMPEEINRLLTDQIAEVLLTPSAEANENLQREGISAGRIHLVGNCMIDTLVRLLAQARPPKIDGLDNRYVLVTLHRPSNVDDPELLSRLMGALEEISRDNQVIFPIHPRTRQRLAGRQTTDYRRQDNGFLLPATRSGSPPDQTPQTSLPLASISHGSPGFRLIEPLGYLEFLWLQQHATAVITDSGGIQEETTFLGVPCLTLRENTERPMTTQIGTNILVGRDPERLKKEMRQIRNGAQRKGQIPPLWDGHAGERVAEIIAERGVWGT